ncbi:ATP-dependent DNA helicase RecG [Mycoplasma sp. P36-A1]|uniref:ATP-dependent DNA helicase RecG n=1 Tax=Mycoplasma sp. P36-A1 TaxID=3252900 RepID=UPI003C2EC610
MNNINLNTKLIELKSIDYTDKKTNKQKKIVFTAKRLKLLEELNLNNINDLIHYFPKRYDYREITPLQEGKVFLLSILDSIIKINFYRPKQSRMNFEVIIDDKKVKVVIFHRHFRKVEFEKAEYLIIQGIYSTATNTITASEIFTGNIDEIKGIHPKYSLPTGYNNKSFQDLLIPIISNVKDQLESDIPNEYLVKYKLLDKITTIAQLHFPTNKVKLDKALQTHIYEEFFLYAIQSIIERKNNSKIKGYNKDIDIKDIPYLLDTLKYTLSDDQKKVLNEIYLDLINSQPMNRLLLADVGSGKTLVALISCYMVFMSGFQSAFLAPTTILATQHYHEALDIFKDIELNIALLTGSTSNAERTVILEDLNKGKIDLLIGTHAIYQKTVIYKNLGLIIFDEQQRFGVAQRQSLKNKGKTVDSLMLSATPIPRTLAQSVYSQLSISTMEKPLPFKKPIISYYYKSKSLKPFMNEMIALLEKKQQVYIITPLVEESSEVDTKNVIDVYKNISMYFKDKYKVGILHGKMKNEQKDETMINFAHHEYDILVATSLIEVGISVANANCIIIYDAHRFGLSQLHQLRGRVGRGKEQGYCVFLSESDEKQAIDKLNFITNNNNGFEIAKYDLETRGPGDMLGVKQSGLPTFNLANIVTHEKIFKHALKDANDFSNSVEEFQMWLKKHQHLIDSLNFYQSI